MTKWSPSSREQKGREDPVNTPTPNWVKVQGRELSNKFLLVLVTSEKEWDGNPAVQQTLRRMETTLGLDKGSIGVWLTKAQPKSSRNENLEESVKIESLSQRFLPHFIEASKAEKARAEGEAAEAMAR